MFFSGVVNGFCRIEKLPILVKFQVPVVMSILKKQKFPVGFAILEPLLNPAGGNITTQMILMGTHPRRQFLKALAMSSLLVLLLL